eukprot:g717.t1
MKGMGFAGSGGDEKAAAFGDALAESVLDEPDAEEQDVGGDDGEGGAGAGEDAANEKEEEEEEAPKSAKAGGEDFEGEEYWRRMSIPDAIMHFLTRLQHLGDKSYKKGLQASKNTSINLNDIKDKRQGRYVLLVSPAYGQELHAGVDDGADSGTADTRIPADRRRSDAHADAVFTELARLSDSLTNTIITGDLNAHLPEHDEWWSRCG